MQPDKTKIPARFKYALDLYAKEGIPPGGFLESVLCDRLFHAIHDGDSEALEALPHIVAYIYNDLPGDCWGSAENIDRYIDKLCKQHLRKELEKENVKP